MEIVYGYDSPGVKYNAHSLFPFLVMICLTRANQCITFGGKVLNDTHNGPKWSITPAMLLCPAYGMRWNFAKKSELHLPRVSYSHIKEKARRVHGFGSVAVRVVLRQPYCNILRGTV